MCCTWHKKVFGLIPSSLRNTHTPADGVVCLLESCGIDIDVVAVTAVDACSPTGLIRHSMGTFHLNPFETIQYKWDCNTYLRCAK